MGKRMLCFDRLRIIAIFAVILIHISGAELFNYGVGSPAWNIHNILDGISRFAVPVFVMISGALFLDPARKVNIRELYGKNILRIVVSFVVWSLLYALAFNNSDLKGFIKAFITGQYHMWFLYMMAGLYIAVPLLRKITENDCLVRYFLIVSFLSTFLIPLIARLPHMSVIADVIEKTNLNIAMGYVGYFVLGFYLSKKELSEKARATIYLSGILGAIATVLLTYLLSVKSGKLDDSFYSYFSITVLAESITLFVFSKYNLSKVPGKERTEHIISLFSKMTFGIYLVHIFILEWVNSLALLSQISNQLVYVSIKLILTFSVSALISYLLNKIPVLKKYIV